MARKKGSKKTKSKKVKLSPEVKEFRSSEEVVSFYRFIHDNNLRHEAKVILETILSYIDIPRKRRSRK